MIFMVQTAHQSAHLVGVCGAGMRALAELLLDEGWSLSGSDLAIPTAGILKLIDRGLVFHQGHAAVHLADSTQNLVYSPAIPLQNPERMRAIHQAIPQFSYSQMVAQRMRRATGVCIAGTHGKSTTTAMVASILSAANRLSGVVLGAELCGSGRSGWSGSGDLFVAESCEFQQSFLDFEPRYTAILSIEPDHFDCYPDLESLKSAFTTFASQTAAEGFLLINEDCPVSREVSTMAKTSALRVSFGRRATADWQVREIEQSAGGLRFRVVGNGRDHGWFSLALHGEHNAFNGLAAAALCAEAGVSLDILRKTLAEFQGIRRRFEFLGERKGSLFFDDYAHHPTAVKATLKTLRNVVGSQAIRCIFQPHQILRTTTLMTEFSQSFSEANEVWVAPVFAARESVSIEPWRVSQELTRQLQAEGISARFFSSLDQIVSTLDDATRPGDVTVTMGAGDIDRIYHELTQRIQ